MAGALPLAPAAVAAIVQALINKSASGRATNERSRASRDALADAREAREAGAARFEQQRFDAHDFNRVAWDRTNSQAQNRARRTAGLLGRWGLDWEIPSFDQYPDFVPGGDTIEERAEPVTFGRGYQQAGQPQQTGSSLADLGRGFEQLAPENVMNRRRGTLGDLGRGMLGRRT